MFVNDSGKLLATACLDRYVRVHHADTCALMYQCYVKSKATRILLRDSLNDPNNKDDDKTAELDDDEELKPRQKKSKKTKEEASEDEEYENMFENMPTIWCDILDFFFHNSIQSIFMI